MCSLETGLWLLKYVGKPTPKIIKRWSRNTDHRLKSKPNKLKPGNAEKEKEREKVFEQNTITYLTMTITTHKMSHCIRIDYIPSDIMR